VQLVPLVRQGPLVPLEPLAQLVLEELAQLVLEELVQLVLEEQGEQQVEQQVLGERISAGKLQELGFCRFLQRR
jgi:hypothetical protein